MFVALSIVAQLAAVALLVGMAVFDARHLRIPNSTVGGLFGLYVIAQGTLGFPFWQGDLLIGAVMFFIGVFLWWARMLGAGDAKVLFPVGMLLGNEGVIAFSVALSLLSLALYAAIKVAVRLEGPSRFRLWLVKMEETGKVPFGVAIAIAAVFVLVAKVGEQIASAA